MILRFFALVPVAAVIALGVVGPGRTTRLTATLKRGRYPYRCTSTRTRSSA
jgi:hypothetical protein